MGKEDKKYLIGFSQFPKFGPVKLKKIKEHFPAWENAFLSNEQELIRAGIKENEVIEFLEKRKEINLEKILEELDKENIQTVSLEEENYPPLLAQIYDPPLLLYYRGNINFLDHKNLAIVGSRKCTYYGKQTIESVVPALIKNNIAIISGLALGIDALAHWKTIEERGKTIAVLGSGLDKKSIYPKNNLSLGEKIIASGGGIISEFPCKTPPLKQNFPQRNRIISGLSTGVLVIEAGIKSGSLITARFALEQGREVLAIPGNIYSATSSGPNNLIKSGAKTITSPEDVLEIFGISLEEEKKKEKQKIIIDLSAEEREILSFMSCDPIHVNELSRLAKLDIGLINSTLSILEIKGIIKNSGNGEYIINF